MLLTEKVLAVLLFLATVGFGAGLSFLPGGLAALRRRAGGKRSPDTRLGGYSPEVLYDLLGRYGPDGTRSFRRLLLIDLLFPPIYGSFLVVLGDLVATTDPIVSLVARLSCAATVVGVCFDYAENLLLLFVIGRLPQRRPLAARLAGISTGLKFASLGVALASLGVAGIVRLAG